MSKTTLRKRIAVIAVSALTVGMLSVASPAAHAIHPSAGGASGTNANAFSLSTVLNAAGAVLPSQATLFVATQANSGSTAAAASHTAGPTNAFSKGLLNKDTSSGTAQSAVVLPGGVLSLYAVVSTAVTFSASAGSFSSLAGIATAAAGANLVVSRSFASYNGNNTKAWLDYLAPVGPVGPLASDVATGVAVLWTAPTTVGTYTVSMSRGYALATNATTYAAPNSSNGDSPTLVGNITVSVVAASSGGSYSAAYSSCKTQVNTATSYNSLVAAFLPGIDSSSSVKNGDQWAIDFDLNDAYAADLDSGNIVVSATNGALVKLGTAGTTPVAGTSSTDVTFGSSISRNVRIDQPTAGAPLTTTVTITFNGTTVCTKTVSIGGKVDKLVVANVGTQALSTATGSVQWMYQEIGRSSAGLFTILATDSAGNIVDTDGLGTFSATSGTTNTTVLAASFPTLSTSRSSSSSARFSLGSFQCGGTAGSANLGVTFTTSSTGASVKSDTFVARCADVPSTYTVSLDKAAYTQGAIATATVQFLDSKGNKANSVTAVGANSWVLPYFSPVTMAGTLAQGASATAVTKADGTSVLTFTVGTTTAVVSGSYAGVVAYDGPALGVKQTPAYTLSTGGDTTTNADVLKSIVALIASINKQIQALQKLILARR